MWYNMIWCDMIWYDMVWDEMIWYDVVWCDIGAIYTSTPYRLTYGDRVIDHCRYDMILYDMMWYDMRWDGILSMTGKDVYPSYTNF